jgi:Tol biopolymer transport system component
MVRSWIVGLVVTGWCLTGGASFAGQDDGFPALHGPYFGQPEPGLQAQRFAPGLVSLPGRYEFALSFSPSGQELLFTQQVLEQSVSVYHSRVQSETWTRPEPVRLSEGEKGEEMEAFFSPDGGRVFFAPYDEGMDVRIWSLEVGPDGWEHPRELGSPVADEPAFYPTVSLDGTLYYTNLAARKIYRAELEGDLVGLVEDAGLEFGGHAFVAPDESFLLVDARAPDSLGGSDIYVAFRRPDGSWSRPRHLGAEVNSGFDETCPSLSADGRFLFFSRYDEPDEVSDIYWIDSTVIDAVRDEPTAVDAFRMLTQLEGRWLGSGGRLGAEPEETVHELTVAAGDSVVMEVMDPEGERELNVYHLVDGDLMLTHYCGAGNQPRLKLDLDRAAPGVLPFTLVDGSGFDPDTDRHIHSARLIVRHGGHLESWWTAEKEGKLVMESRFVLERAAEGR